jgi:hypothetical protein
MNIGSFLRASVWVLVVAGIFSPPRLRAQVSPFTTGIQGWSVVSFGYLQLDDYSVVGTYTPTFVAAGGNPGGYIEQTSDPDGGDFTFSAPAAYLGNHGSSYGSAFTYDILYSATVNYQTTDLMLVGGGTRLLWQSNPVLVPSGTWTSVSAVLAPSGQWHVGTTGGSLATVSDFVTVLSNLTGVYIRGEYAIGPDRTGIDNVQFSAVPEPGTLALLTAGLIPGALFARRFRLVRQRAVE